MAAKSGLSARLAARFGDDAGLYFVKTGEKTGYVGQSSDVARRLGQHIGTGKFGEGQMPGGGMERTATGDIPCTIVRTWWPR